MLNFLFKIKKVKQTSDFGHFIVEPLPRGFGHTLGNSLRRVLLGSLSGAAITQIKINGVKHKFSTLSGLKEDIIELVLNIKQIDLQYEGEKPVKIHLEKSGRGQVKVADIKAPATVKIINKDLVLANLADKKSRLKMEMIVESGTGYLLAEERKSNKVGIIPIDAAFSPVRRVNYRVEDTRVGRQTDLDRLILEITTDGTIKPMEALKEAAKTLVAFFNQVVEPKKIPASKKETKPVMSEVMHLTV